MTELKAKIRMQEERRKGRKKKNPRAFRKKEGKYDRKKSYR